MKILKNILIVLAVIIALVAIVGMFISPKVTVVRSMDMKSAPDAVYNQIADLKMWDNWMPWNKIDPNMKKSYGEKSAGEGASYSWVSDHSEVGKGTITITKAIPQEVVETNLHFDGQGDANGGFAIQKTGNGSNVTWSMNMDMGGNPFKRIMGSMMDKMMGPYFDKGLRSLDSAAALNPVSPPVAMVDTAAQQIPDTLIAK